MRTIFGLGALLLTHTAYAAPTWSQVEAVSDWRPVATKSHKVAGPIDIFSSTIAGTLCFRAIANTTVPPTMMMNVARDIVGSLKWSTAGLTRSEVLGRTATSIDYLQYIDVPNWTFTSDRFWVLRGTSSTTGNKQQ